MKALTIAVALLGVLGSACAHSLRGDIDSANAAITNAMKNKDFPKLTKLMYEVTTKDFKFTENGQSQDVKTMLGNMKLGIGMMTKIKVCSAKLLTISQHGNTAVGTTRHTVSGTTIGPDKKPHSMSFVGVSLDTYVKQNGKWKMSSMTWKSTKQLMDGKPVAG